MPGSRWVCWMRDDADRRMRVTVERSGGFAGITTTSSVDDLELSSDEARTLGELIRALDRPNSRPLAEPSAGIVLRRDGRDGR